MFILYKPVIFLHILAGSVYMLAHGTSAATSFRLKKEDSLERIRALLDLSQSTFGVMWISLLVLLLAGIALGFLGSWWGSGWSWVSLGLLIAMIVAMSAIASRQFHDVRKAAGLSYMQGSKELPAVEPAPMSEIQSLLSRGTPHLLTTIGVGGWAVILWLMVFKPF